MFTSHDHFYTMNSDNRELNSCICKCGSVSCRNIHIHGFKDQIPKEEENQFKYSVLHHKSLRVLNSKSVVVDRCCGNILHFHCAKCHDQFSIIKSQSLKYKFIFGFNSECLAHLEPTDSNDIIIIPDFPIALKSFVCLSEQKTYENNKINKSSHLINNSFKNYKNDEDDEIFSFDSDEDIMFGKDQTDLIIGKYNEASISSFNERSHLLNNSFKNYEIDEDDEKISFDSNEIVLLGKDHADLIIGKYNEASSFSQCYSIY